MDTNDKNEFDLDFDFEKEYGFSPETIMGTDFNDEDFNLDFLSEEPAAEYTPESDPEAEPVYAPEFEPVYTPEFEPTEEFVQNSLAEEFVQNALADEPVPEDLTEAAPEETVIPEDPAAEQMPPLEPEQPAAPLTRAEMRRLQKLKRKKIKELYLPAAIAGVSVLLMLIFIIGGIARAITHSRERAEDALNASLNADAAAEARDQEAARLLEQAAELASGYNYQGAIDLLNSFSGEQTAYPEMVSAKAAYSQALTQVKAWSDPSEIANLSFHVLIADPSRAFTDKAYGTSYNKNFVTIDEFQLILEQLYNNGYVLVDLDDVVTATTGVDGTTTYTANTIYLPVGKTPIMLTETMVNYFTYMVDGDGDGEPDEKGGGFAHKLVLDANGDIKAEMVNADGETVVGDYDLVPILETFIEEHPDFSYQGARAILAVSGYDGIFGYRINGSNSEEVSGAKTIVSALKDKGYTLACYTYENVNYNDNTVAFIQNDLQKWSTEILPVLGSVDVMVFARGVDISDYTGNKFTVLYSSGFRYYIGAATSPWAEVSDTYFHQKRLMVTGTQMAYSSSTYSDYFNSMGILNDLRGTVPT